MNSGPVRTRIAPTPSGFLHIGNLFSFVLTWLEAKKHGGTVLLRIDDLDAERMRPEFLEDIFRVLEYIGLTPDEGPSGPYDFIQNYSQLTRLNYYHSYVDRLVSSHSVYACSCSRKQVLSLNPEGIYPGTCRRSNFGLEDAEFALRLALPTNATVEFFDFFKKQKIIVDVQKEMGDFVVRRKGGMPAYQLASMADDFFYNINLIVRGADLTVSTAAQLKLAEILSIEKFSTIRWMHHPLIPNHKGEKLSKSAGSTSVRWMIEQGATKADILVQIGLWIFGEEKALTSLNQMLEIYCLQSQ